MGTAVINELAILDLPGSFAVVATFAVAYSMSVLVVKRGLRLLQDLANDREVNRWS